MNVLSRIVRAGLLAAVIAGFSLLLYANSAQAHDEHNNLPNTGVAVDGDVLRISREAEKSLGLVTEVVHLKDLERDVMANSAVEVPWRQHAYVTSLVAGRISRVHVQPGDKVDHGQVLAQVESQEIEDLQTALLKAASELDLANRLLEERTSLASSGSMSERRLLESQAIRNELAAERGILVLKLLSLGLTSPMIDEILTSGKPVRTVPITSPIGGVVSVSNVRAGQVVAPWQQVYEIVDLSTVWVHGQVLETDSTLVKEGQPVDISVDAFPDKVFKAEVGHVGVKLDPELRTMHVHVEVDNKEKLLRDGMFGRLRIRATVVREAVACPVDAVVDPGNQPYVVVLERRGATPQQPSVFLRQPVELGLRSGGFVEVIDGLFPGDPVVTTGKHELASLFAAESAGLKTAVASGGQAADTLPTPRTSDSSTRPVIAQAQVELPTDRKASAYSTVTGRIANILVEHGEAVRAGQVLAEVESLDLRNVQLELLRAESQLKLSRKLLERHSQLSQTGGVSQKDLWQVQTDTENLQTSVDSLKNKLSLMGLSDEEISRIARLDITDNAATDAIRTTSEIRAPIDGRITVFDLSIGQVVRPQDELFEIHDTSQVVIRGYVHEQDSADVRVGQPVTATITADPQFSATSVIERTAPTLSAWGRAMSVWVALDNPSGKLKEGMLARLAITASKEPPQTAKTDSPTESTDSSPRAPAP
jgi:membrane fusion protein, heavy metal efflux system